MVASNRFWFVLPLWLWLVADVALTLGGQPTAFWHGDYSAALEGNPLVYPILARGPGSFILFAVVWGMFLGVCGVCCSNPVARGIIVLAAVSHAVAGGTWLARFETWGWSAAVLYLFVASEVSWWCWRRTGGVSKEKLN